MKNSTINQIEDTNITLDVILGLSQTINDLVGENMTLLTEYPSSDKRKKYQADRLASKLLALSSAAIQITKQAEGQINTAVSLSYKERRRQSCK